MNTKMYTHTLQRRLEDEREQLLKQLGNNLDESDEARELKIYLLKQHLREVEYALHRFEQGTYGLCDICGQPIEQERLGALPQANLCLSCKARQAKKKAKGYHTRAKLLSHHLELESE